jgi:DNA-directed RNA polymerase subunit RPC12/RpoP
MPMRWRWLIGNYIDPSLQLTREQRREVRARAHKLSGTAWRRWGDLALIILIMFAPWQIAWLLVAAGDGGGPDTSLAEWCALAIFVGWLPLSPVICLVACAVFAYRCRRPYVFMALQSLGFEVCGRCGYRLRGLGEAATRCPECGEPRSTCTCPHCGTTLPFRSARGMKCPRCGHGLDEAVPLLAPWITRWYGHPTVDPRLKKKLPRGDRRALRRRVLAELRWWQRVIIVICLVIFLVPVIVVAHAMVSLFTGLAESVWATSEWPTLVIIFAAAGAVIVARVILGRIYGRPVRRALRQEGYEVCVRCGDWLRDLTDREKRCPLCGAERQPMARSEKSS